MKINRKAEVAMKSIRIKNAHQTYHIVLMITLFFILLESVFPFRMFSHEFSVFKITFFANLILFIGIVLVEYRGNMYSAWKICTSSVRSVWILYAFLLLYILFDIVSFAWTSDIHYAAAKYVTIVQMAAFLVMMLFDIFVEKENSQKKIESSFLIICAAGFTAGILGLVNNIFEIPPTAYSLRISPIDDYNQFSTVILLGFVCGYFYACHYKKGVPLYVSICVLSSIFVPLIYMCSSRRTFLLMSCFLGVIVIHRLVCDTALPLKAKNPKRAMAGFLSLLLVAGISAGVTLPAVHAYTDFSQTRYEHRKDLEKKLKASKKKVSKKSLNLHSNKIQPEKDESEISQYMDTINEGSALNKRKVIWKIALDELKTYRMPEILIGKGASHNSDLYDTSGLKTAMNLYYLKKAPPKHWLNPHDYLLVDLLDGGIVKLLFSLGITFSLLVVAISMLMKDFSLGFPITVLLGIIFANLLISAPLGILAGKNFWVVLTLTTAEYYCIRKNDVLKL